jgi:cyclic-di-GMP phosphodiesterase TipF (flagellum assembly factor)
MINVLVVTLYTLIALLFGGTVSLFAGPLTGLLTGMIVFLTAAQWHNHTTRRRDRRQTAKEISQLRQVGVQFEQALGETRGKMDEMSKAIEARASAQSRKIVAELQVLESLMKDFAGKISAKAKEQPVEETFIERRAAGTAKSYLASLGESDLLETIRASLEENRVDLYLQPIVSLPQRKLRYYEALSRLRAADGAVIMPAQYMKVAAPAGLMSVVDNLLLFRCVQIVRRLTARQKDIGVFCNISAETLSDTEFFPQFLEYMHHNRDLAGQIVFEFDQDAVLNAGPQGDSNLLYLSNLGFALSMDHVQVLNLDFAKLKGLGFRHLKVRADILTQGMSAANAAVAAEDFKKLLERYGMNLIAERVEEEKTVVQLLDYSVDFAQGYLFGEPRAVRDDSLRSLDKVEAPQTSIVPFRRTA